MPDPGTMTFSKLSAYLSCPKKYFFTYVDRAPLRPFAPLICGSLMHQALELGEAEEMWKYGPDVVGNSVPLKHPEHRYAIVHPKDGVLTKWFREHMIMAFEEVGGIDQVHWAGKKTREFPNGEDGLWWYEQAASMFRRWATIRTVDNARGIDFEPSNIERQIIIPLPDGRPLRITLDALMYRSREGRLIVRDYKTGVRNQSDPKQMWIYGYGVTRLMGEIPDTEFCYLRGINREQQLVPVNVEGSIGEPEEWFAWLAAALQTGFFPAFPSSWCKSCPHLDSCAVGAQYVQSGSR